MTLVSTTFLPSTHGWAFENGFDYQASLIGLDIPLSMSFGFCGGMCLTALDRYLSCRTIEKVDKPTQGTALYKEIRDRQLDSLRSNGGFIWARVYDWQRRPDVGHPWWMFWLPKGLARLTREEWPGARASIDRGDPVTLCLIQVEGYTANPSENHQVLAYKYDFDESTKALSIWVYDPNDPGNDDVVITLSMGSGPLNGYRNNTTSRMRGFFPIDWIAPTSGRDVKLKTLDFAPVGGGSYDVNWPGPPRRQMQYADVKHFQPILELDGPATRRLTLGFNVKERRDYWFDPTLGSFTAVFERCSKTPDEIVTLNVGVGGERPPGAPTRTNDSFWLGATKRGKIRGNEGKGDDAHAKVYIESFQYFSLAGTNRSSVHTVNAM